MGDIINSIPAALELKKKHPGATFIYNCDASSACLPRIGGVTDFVTSCVPIGLISHWYLWLLDGFYAFSSDDDENLIPGRHTERHRRFWEKCRSDNNGDPSGTSHQ